MVVHAESHPPKKRRGVLAVVGAMCLMITMAFLAFSVDWGFVALTESELQNAADSGALSGARALKHGRDAAIAAARSWAGKNMAGGQTVVVTADEDVEIGVWESATRRFVPLSSGFDASANAVRVTTRRTTDRGNPLQLFIGSMFGAGTADLQATAVGVRAGGGQGTRFLIDDEMIDTDVPAIEALARRVGRSTSSLLTARGFNLGKLYGSSGWTWEDHFLDVPPGEVLSLPTGQGTSYENNDAGLFDITHPAFPFTGSSSFLDFLMYSETGGDSTKWGTDSRSIRDQLDPLPGVSPVTDGSRYASFVDPDFVHVSPVFSSDISTLNMQSGEPRVNAKGLRRGLIAFKIIGVGVDRDGRGSLLPELVIEVVAPSTVSPTGLAPATGPSGGKARLVY